MAALVPPDSRAAKLDRPWPLAERDAHLPLQLFRYAGALLRRLRALGRVRRGHGISPEPTILERNVRRPGISGQARRPLFDRPRPNHKPGRRARNTAGITKGSREACGAAAPSEAGRHRPPGAEVRTRRGRGASTQHASPGAGASSSCQRQRVFAGWEARRDTVGSCRGEAGTKEDTEEVSGRSQFTGGTIDGNRDLVGEKERERESSPFLIGSRQTPPASVRLRGMIFFFRTIQAHGASCRTFAGYGQARRLELVAYRGNP